jgi:hypothetical protein
MTIKLFAELWPRNSEDGTYVCQLTPKSRRFSYVANAMVLESNGYGKSHYYMSLAEALTVLNRAGYYEYTRDGSGHIYFAKEMTELNDLPPVIRVGSGTKEHKMYDWSVKDEYIKTLKTPVFKDEIDDTLSLSVSNNLVARTFDTWQEADSYQRKDEDHFYHFFHLYRREDGNHVLISGNRMASMSHTMAVPEGFYKTGYALVPYRLVESRNCFFEVVFFYVKPQPAPLPLVAGWYLNDAGIDQNIMDHKELGHTYVGYSFVEEMASAFENIAATYQGDTPTSAEANAHEHYIFWESVLKSMRAAGGTSQIAIKLSVVDTK